MESARSDSISHKISFPWERLMTIISNTYRVAINASPETLFDSFAALKAKLEAKDASFKPNKEK